MSQPVPALSHPGFRLKGLGLGFRFGVHTHRQRQRHEADRETATATATEAQTERHTNFFALISRDIGTPLHMTTYEI